MSKSPTHVAKFADAVISAQTGEIAQLKSWRQAWVGSDQTPSLERMPMVPGMSGHGEHGAMDMAADVEQLRAAPEPVDHAFIDAMIPHHESAIDAAQAAESRAQRAEIQQLAAAIVSDQQREIVQMAQWRDAWFGPHEH